MRNSEMLKQMLKNVIEFITEITVRHKNDLLNKFDDCLKSFRKVMDQAVMAIKTSNEYNMNEIVESLLKQIKNGNDTVATL